MYQQTPATKRYLGFVIGHDRPALVEVGARYWRAHDDGAPMVADGHDDTPGACRARHATAKGATRTKSASAKSKVKS